MAKQPWVTPEEVVTYSEIESVQNRSKERLKVDIMRAEQYVITYTHNDFSNFENIPTAVKTAILILAEAYARNSYLAATKDLKSETFDDYSYTAESSTIDIDGLDLSALLDDFVLAVPSGNVIMRLRKL